MPPALKLQIEAAVFGNLPELMKEEADRGAAAASRGTDRTVIWLKGELRAQIMAAFGSQRLANTWRSNVYPRLPRTSLGVAGTVYSKAPHIILAFEQATTIRSSKGFWLAIPSPECPKSFANKRVTPSNWNDEKYGKLRFVYRSGKASLLVVDNVGVGKTGKVTGQRLLTKAGGYRKGSASVVMFFLVPAVQLKKKLDPEGAYAKALDQLVSNILDEWNAE